MRLLGVIFSLALLVFALTFKSTQAADRSEPSVVKPPFGLPALPVPNDNPQTPEKVELGKQLYFDKRLSIDHSISCATCHDPQKGWSNGEATAAGVKGSRGKRNSPTVLNTAYQTFQFWDGRADSLEAQAIGPMMNPIEMAMPSSDVVVERLMKIPGYVKQFKTVFGSEPTIENAAKAIAAFERTVLSGDAPFDRFMAGDKSALTAQATRGKELFFNKAHCSACHSGPNFTDNAFHNIGTHLKSGDVGRAGISKMEGDTGSFKTPTLREIARTAPYMHDGSMSTLEEVIDHYDKGGVANPQLDEEIFEINLTPEEKKDLVAFLKEGLAGLAYPDVKPPNLPE